MQAVLTLTRLPNDSSPAVRHMGREFFKCSPIRLIRSKPRCLALHLKRVTRFHLPQEPKKRADFRSTMSEALEFMRARIPIHYHPSLRTQPEPYPYPVLRSPSCSPVVPASSGSALSTTD